MILAREWVKIRDMQVPSSVTVQAARTKKTKQHFKHSKVMKPARYCSAKLAERLAQLRNLSDGTTPIPELASATERHGQLSPDDFRTQAMKILAQLEVFSELVKQWIRTLTATQSNTNEADVQKTRIKIAGQLRKGNNDATHLLHNLKNQCTDPSLVDDSSFLTQEHLNYWIRFGIEGPPIK